MKSAVLQIIFSGIALVALGSQYSIPKSTNISSQPVLAETDTVVIQNDTLFLENSNYLNENIGLSKCSGKIDGVDIYFIAKTSKSSSYTYCIGSSPEKTEKFENYESAQLTILLLKKATVVNELNLDQHISRTYNTSLVNPKRIELSVIDEVLTFNINQEFCGGLNASVYFFRKREKLIKGLTIEQSGEPGIEYHTQEIIAPDNNKPNQIWVKNEIGKGDMVYITETEKYELKNDSIIRLNPKKDNFFFRDSKKWFARAY
jgi:hypothetical protein